jgi:hypothetical protein
MKNTVKSAMIGIKTTKQVRDILEKCARAEDRTLSNYINKVLRDHLKSKGLLKSDD